jgi:glycosyltransferase involved in cell wall biosynthesis
MKQVIIDNPYGTGKLKITIEKFEEQKSNTLYIFGWPSHLGGADTRLVHSLKLWSKFMNITVIPNGIIHKNEWTDFLDTLGCKYSTLEELPDKLDGIGLSMCNDYFFSRKICHKAKEKGLRIIWSSEMMWHHMNELDAVKEGLVDTVLYTSTVQKNKLKPSYDKCEYKLLKEYTIDNYIDGNDFPFVNRNDKTSNITIGRISRSDVDKYPENFPLFYENLNLNNPNYMVMAWNDQLKKKYSWHSFSKQWKLLNAVAVPVNKFLEQLDIFVYPLGHKFTESWGRSTAEAMLTGLPVVVPKGHNFHYFIKNEETGFIYKDYEECREICQKLQNNPSLRKQIGIAAREDLMKNIFNIDKHTSQWKEIFNV